MVRAKSRGLGAYSSGYGLGFRIWGLSVEWAQWLGLRI